MLFSAGVTLTVVAVEASATGAVWVLERASDGARATVRLGSQAAGALSVAAGTVVVVTAMSTGWVLSTASEAIAFIPNEIGAALLYNERVTR
jgi:uridine phosphorylase